MPAPLTLVHSGKGRVEATSEGSRLTLRFHGILDEEILARDLADAIQKSFPDARTIEFDLSGVTRMNSNGVQQWIFLVQFLPKEREYVFSHLSDIFVAQVNMSPNMLGLPGAVVTSFFAPFRCEPCGKESRVEITPEQVRAADGGFIVPATSCAQCGNPMDFDDLEDEFFGFLER